MTFLVVGCKKQFFTGWSIVEPGYDVLSPNDPLSGLCPYEINLSVYQPTIDPNPIMIADRPWEAFINGAYCTLMEDEGLYRLWYEDWVKVDGIAMPTLAYAESNDGLHWSRPNTNVLEFVVPDHNIVHGTHSLLHGVTVFKDVSAPTDSRYKLIHGGSSQDRHCVYGAESPDGIHWIEIRKPLLENYLSDTQTIVRFDEQRGVYVGYFRGWTNYQKMIYRGRRAIAYAETEDFYHWPRPKIIVETSPIDEPSTDIYTSGYTTLPNSTEQVMFPTFYHRDTDQIEVRLMTSSDGIAWNRWTTPLVSPNEAWNGGYYAGCGLVQLPDGHWLLPVAPKAFTHNQPELEPGCILGANWQRDRLTSLDAPKVGEFSTIPLIYTGKKLLINAVSMGGIRVGLMTPENKFIDGHSIDECNIHLGNGYDCVVSWKGESDLSQWAGQSVRLHFHMSQAKLFSFQFV